MESQKTSFTYPQGHTVLRQLSRRYPVISYGKGVYLFDKNGKRYLDAVAGALVVSVGHGNQEVINKIQEQLSRVAYVNGMQFTSDVIEALSTRLAEKASVLGLNRCSFLCSGSEAVEAAIKFARQLCVEQGQSQRTKLISRSPSYHGNTLVALSLSGRPHYRKFFEPYLTPVSTVSAPNRYRFPGRDFEADGADYYAKELTSVIEREGAENITALIVEPIVGSSAGAQLPPPGYFEKIQAICSECGILMIADEIMVGCGRTGTFFASEPLGCRPDILTLGKGINGGYAPLSALMVKEDHVQQMKAGTGSFLHAQTFMQAPCMGIAGLAVLDYMDRHNVIDNAKQVGELLQTRLETEIAPLPYVGCVNGKGLIAGIEFVEDKLTKQPFKRSDKVVEGIVARAFELGLTLWPNIGHVDGVQGDLIMIGPPLTISSDEVEELISLLKRSITSHFA